LKYRRVNDISLHDPVTARIAGDSVRRSVDHRSPFAFQARFGKPAAVELQHARGGHGSLRNRDLGDLMIFSLFGRRKTNQRVVDDTYVHLTEAARQPLFYERFGVPDTVMGRFEMVAVHMVLFLRRAGQADGPLRAFTQEMVDTFFQDIDHSIREIGIGDTGVPKRMKKFAKMFYGRVESYSVALNAGDRVALSEALSRNVHPTLPFSRDSAEGRGMHALADHLVALEAHLAGQPDGSIMDGRLSFVVPEVREAV
jgi:cytochrome b pre-mRNA-processing protein 3